MLTCYTYLRGVSVKIESASSGNRTRTRRVAGEDSTAEPSTRMQIQHLRITHLPTNDVTWGAIRVSAGVACYAGVLQHYHV